MKVLSLYCGAGNIDNGLKNAGLLTTTAIDINKDCCETMKLNHECEVICGRVSDYQSSFSGYDVVVGGPPCQDFSPANPTRKFDLTEVRRFWEIVDRLKPKYFLMENVPLLATKFTDRPSYEINCADYGTPQRRKRRIWSNIEKPKGRKWKCVEDYLDVKGHISPSGFPKRNEYLISTPTTEPCKTILVATRYRLTDKPVYSKKYPKLPQDYKIIRDLTLEELAILQGFPKGYRFYGSASSVKKQIGNACPSQAITKIFSQIQIQKKPKALLNKVGK